ncbi:hypothetical protein AC249_AIPGENE25430 [Exaiptasia diaphana]|nr:hypothetical protein AC249_AIPGENE25430 [Exaiptasia diaphana]
MNLFPINEGLAEATNLSSYAANGPPLPIAKQSKVNIQGKYWYGSSKLEGIEKSLQKVQVFVAKGPENIYKDVTIFTRDMLKCPICCYVTKDEIPHATSIVFFCPLYKQRMGPLNNNGFRNPVLSRKVAIIPEETV